MAKYLIQSESLTAIADEIRVLSGTEEAMSLNTMESHISEANANVDTEADLIAQISSALEGKTGSGGQVDWSENEDAIINRTISGEYSNDRLQSVGSCAFAICTKLTAVSFPNCTSIGDSAFYYCDNLTVVSFPNCINIGSYAFARCLNLKSLYLTGSSICKLSNSNAFSYTPIGGYSTSAGTYGSIYVPTSLLTSYKAATNWTYFSSRFVGI